MTRWSGERFVGLGIGIDRRCNAIAEAIVGHREGSHNREKGTPRAVCIAGVLRVFYALVRKGESAWVGEVL